MQPCNLHKSLTSFCLGETYTLDLTNIYFAFSIQYSNARVYKQYCDNIKIELHHKVNIGRLDLLVVALSRRMHTVLLTFSTHRFFLKHREKKGYKMK